MKIGWIIPRWHSYNKVMASTRLRVFDVINYLKLREIKTSLYFPFRNYDVVIFQKAFLKRHIRLAEKLKTRNTKIVLDINVNYLNDDSMFVTAEQQTLIKRMIEISDAIITSSIFLKNLYREHHHDVTYIPEIIHENFFSISKNQTHSKKISFVYCGYAVKAAELGLIKDILIELQNKYESRLLIISEKDPKLSFLPYTFIRYNQENLPRQLITGDIKIAPRDLSRRYNLGHSFTKIGYPMAVGLPVVAAPVPSYEGSPAIICKSEEEWKGGLTQLIEDVNYRQKVALNGIKYAEQNYSSTKVIPLYFELFERLLQKKK